MRDDSLPSGTKIHFSATTAQVRRCRPVGSPVSHATSRHGAQLWKLESGFILIEESWYNVPDEN